MPTVGRREGLEGQHLLISVTSRCPCPCSALLSPREHPLWFPSHHPAPGARRLPGSRDPRDSGLGARIMRRTPRSGRGASQRTKSWRGQRGCSDTRPSMGAPAGLPATAIQAHPPPPPIAGSPTGPLPRAVRPQTGDAPPYSRPDLLPRPLIKAPPPPSSGSRFSVNKSTQREHLRPSTGEHVLALEKTCA